MCSAVNGLALAPGETLSLNELVGERTAEKGFLPAPAITDGKDLTDELGGGICQLTGTLYNAALLANMEIVERVHHSWPSDYQMCIRDSFPCSPAEKTYRQATKTDIIWTTRI